LLTRNPDKHLGPLARLYRNYYFKYEWKVIQLLPECAQFNDRLAYTLKSGECQFANQEFDTQYRINSLGLRDDEDSLVRPEIIVTGDSFAMGWGVEQDETYAELLEQRLGKKVLNAGVSSYGTVREMISLERVDIENLRYLIIQYSPNDLRENKTFSENGDDLPIMAESDYQHHVLEHQHRTRGYRFGLYIYELQKLLVNELIKKVRTLFMPETGVQKDHAQEAAMFINALQTAKINLDKVQIIVCEMGDRGNNDNNFVHALKEKAIEPGRPEFIKNMQVVDLSKVLSKEHYFTLDPHINAQGHRVVGDVLIKLLARNQ
jgi:hypothetical protein